MAAVEGSLRTMLVASASPPTRASSSSASVVLHMPSSGLRTSRLARCVSVPGSRVHRLRKDLRASADAASGAPGAVAPAITLSDNALAHLSKMRADQNKDLLLRVGVRQGGCSGMSYVMDFEERSKLRPEDSIIDYEGFSMVCDPKSLLFLFGMRLDYSDALIGGGFSFSNPNATSTCGCGKSFAA